MRDFKIKLSKFFFNYLIRDVIIKIGNGNEINLKKLIFISIVIYNSINI